MRARTGLQAGRGRRDTTAGVNPGPPARWLYGWAFLLGCGLLLYLLRGVLTPVLFALALAYLLDPLVDRLQLLHVPRVAGIAILLVVALSVLALGALLVLPQVVSDVGSLARELPQAVSRLLENVQPWLAAHGVPLPRSGNEAISALEQHVQELVPDAMELGQSVLGAVLGSTASVFSAVAALIIVPVLAFHLLRDFDDIVAAVVDLIPASQRERTTAMGREVNAVLGQFVRGQLTVMAIVAALYAGGYTLVGVHLAIPIGLVAGLLSFVPYVGSALALALALLMTALHFHGVGQLISVTAVYGGVQILEGFVITPRIVGDKLGLAPVWVLLALMAGGELFGFLGVMLALPTAAVIKVFAGHGLRRYRKSALYGRSAAEADHAPGARLVRRRLRMRRARRVGHAP
jgi:predicted PurR-regulated permease PerM